MLLLYYSMRGSHFRDSVRDATLGGADELKGINYKSLPRTHHHQLELL